MADEQPSSDRGYQLDLKVSTPKSQTPSPDTDDDKRFRRRATAVTLGVMLGLICAEIIGDIVSQFLQLPFRVNEAIVGTLLGGALLLVGIRGLPKIR